MGGDNHDGLFLCRLFAKESAIVEFKIVLQIGNPNKSLNNKFGKPHSNTPSCGVVKYSLKGGFCRERKSCECKDLPDLIANPVVDIVNNQNATFCHKLRRGNGDAS